MNVDCALTLDTGSAGIGIIARDHRGTVILSAWKSLSAMDSAEEVEALACREGLLLAAEWIQKPVILESDRSTVIGYLSKKQKQRAPSFFSIQDAMQEGKQATQGRL